LTPRERRIRQLQRRLRHLEGYVPDGALVQPHVLRQAGELQAQLDWLLARPHWPAEEPEPTEAERCPACQGAKRVRVERQINDLMVECPACWGTGRRVQR
jgi:hypothetical protein